MDFLVFVPKREYLVQIQILGSVATKNWQNKNKGFFSVGLFCGDSWLKNLRIFSLTRLSSIVLELSIVSIIKLFALYINI